MGGIWINKASSYTKPLGALRCLFVFYLFQTELNLNRFFIPAKKWGHNPSPTLPGSLLCYMCTHIKHLFTANIQREKLLMLMTEKKKKNRPFYLCLLRHKCVWCVWEIMYLCVYLSLWLGYTQSDGHVTKLVEALSGPEVHGDIWFAGIKLFLCIMAWSTL